MSDWISVEDKPVPENTVVWLCDIDNYDPIIGERYYIDNCEESDCDCCGYTYADVGMSFNWNPDQKRYIAWDGDEDDYRVTHWQHLPSPPKEDE